MLLIVEIILTVAAWKRGWKGWALLPILVGLAAAFITGFIVAVVGGSEESLTPFGIAFDILVIGALVTMIGKSHKPASLEEHKYGLNTTGTIPGPESTGTEK